MLEQEKIRIDDKSIWELRKMLPEEKLTIPEECFSILDEGLTFISWGVLKNQVILLTAFARILLIVQEDDPNMVHVEYFPSLVNWEENPHRKTFVLNKKYLQKIKQKILENRNCEVDFSEIVYGQYYD